VADDAGVARLRTEALSGVRWAALSMVLRTAVQLVQIVVLARLLPPADFGLMALAMALVSILQIFGDLGVSNAIISRGSLSPQQLSSLYWLNVAVSALLAIGLLIAGPWVADFYAEPALQPILALAALALLIGAAWHQLRIRAEKDLRFKPLALLEIAAAFAGLAAALVLALQGAGVYALMGGVLAGQATSALLAWAWLAQGWRPQLRLRFEEVRGFLSFGANVIGGELANTVGSHIDVVLGAKFLGAQAMGVYSLPKNLCLQIIGVINPVVTRVGLPVMARSKDDAVLLRHVYLQTLRMTASVNFPIFIGLALFAPEAVRLVFGSQWDAAVAPLQIFAGWALMRSAVNPVGSLALACGRADLMFRWNLASLPIIIPAVAAGAGHGVQGLALALAAIGLLALLANWFFLVRPLCGASALAYSGQLAVPLLLAAAAAPVAWLAASAATGDFARLAAGVAAGAAAYLALSMAFNRNWLDTLLELFKLR